MNVRAVTAKSMTGHGLGESALGHGRVQVEIRALNHRYLEVRVRLPAELTEHAGYLEELVRRSLGRGRIEVTGRLTADAVPVPQLDVARARAAFEQIVALRDALSPGEPVPLGLLGSVPELFTLRGGADLRTGREALSRAAEQACALVCQMRQREGEALTVDLLARAERLIEHVKQIEARAPRVVAAARKRLAERLELLLLPNTLPVDPLRIDQEIAVLADRCDVTEECTRMRSHVQQFHELLSDAGGEALGRRLDFLLQEMAREANTMGAKSADAEVARQVVELKADIERMREQVQNVM